MPKVPQRQGTIRQSRKRSRVKRRATLGALMVLRTSLAVSNALLSNRANKRLPMLRRRVFASALRGTAAPGPQAFEGASYRSRQAALCGVAAKNSVALVRARPNPSIEGTSNIRLRQLSAAPHVKR